jgi:hypothetical protein
VSHELGGRDVLLGIAVGKIHAHHVDAGIDNRFERVVVLRRRTYRRDNFSSPQHSGWKRSFS